MLNLQQLRTVCEVVKQGLKMSSAAKVLDKSQTGVSRQIKEIENELGIVVFKRKRNKIDALTPIGQEVIVMAERILREVASLRMLGKEYSKNDVGQLAIATTHTHARYTLPKAVEAFTRRFPNVTVTLRQGSPAQCNELVASGEAEIGISGAGMQSLDDVVSLPVYQIMRSVIARSDHPILKEQQLTLVKLSQYSIIAFEAAFGGSHILREAFSRAGLKPRVMLTAVDADVIKAYVERGLGIAIIANVAFDPTKDRNLRVMDASKLFNPTPLYVSLRKHGYLRSYVYSFISIFAPHPTALYVSLRKHGYLRSYVYSFISIFAPHLPNQVIERAIKGIDINLDTLTQETL